MPIENRNLEPGTKLVGRYKGQTYHAEVVQTEEGIRYRLGDGREFKSPSSAGAGPATAGHSGRSGAKGGRRSRRRSASPRGQASDRGRRQASSGWRTEGC